MGVDCGIALQEDKMQSLVLAAVLSLTAARPQLPAGGSAAQCPNYPFCGTASPADFPVQVVNGAPVAPILNTTPEQTQYWQQAQVPAQTAAHENPLLIAQQQQLQQLIDAQTIQHRQQQQEIEAARHFGRL